MAFSLTGNYILDFALIQALSVFYLSDAALVLMKWRESENQAVRRLFEPPAAAWYEKAAGTNLKLVSSAANPCMKTTGYSIQVLSRMAEILPDYRVVSCLSSPSLCKEWKTIAALQLQFCLEYQKENKCTPRECAAILEGGAFLLHAVNPMEEGQDFLFDLQKLSQKIMEELDIDLAGTMELAVVIRGLTAWLRRNHINHQRSDFLSSLVLEILNRKNRSGLFRISIEGYASVPIGQQLFILDVLLQSYPYVQLDFVLEQIFDMFSSLYRFAYKDAIELLSFKRKNISYTAFEIGALITCLSSIGEYSTNESGQKNTINKMIDSFLELLVQSYIQSHEKEIKRLIRWICLSHEGIIQKKDKPSIRTIFPKRIHLSNHHAGIAWNRNGLINQADILYLCCSMISLIDKNDTNDLYPGNLKIDIPTMESLKVLYELLFHP
jgi:hypothetical protein